MKKENIYEEKIVSKEITIIFVAGVVGFLFLILYQLYEIIVELEPIRPLAIWALALFLFSLWTIVNFNNLSIKMTSRSVVVKYGFSERTISWENISDCYLDKTSIAWYDGWGLRMRTVNGKRRNEYNVVRYPRVVLSLKEVKFFKEFVFSTKNPEEVMRIINERISGVK